MANVRKCKNCLAYGTGNILCPDEDAEYCPVYMPLREERSAKYGNAFESVVIRLCEKAVKFDDGKPMIDLVVPEFVEGVAKVMTMGAKKYGIENWKKGLESRRILAALYRHILAYHKGEKIDPESGLNHMLHAAANAMFLFWYDEQEEK